MRLMEAVSPGAKGVAMVEGILENQYRDFNEFTLSSSKVGYGQPSETTRCCEQDYKREVIE